MARKSKKEKDVAVDAKIEIALDREIFFQDDELKKIYEDENKRKIRFSSPLVRLRQKIFLKALQKFYGLIPQSLAWMKENYPKYAIVRRTHEHWMNHSEWYRRMIDSIMDSQAERVEAEMIDSIMRDKNAPLMMFYLKHKGKKLGYQNNVMGRVAGEEGIPDEMNEQFKIERMKMNEVMVFSFVIARIAAKAGVSPDMIWWRLSKSYYAEHTVFTSQGVDKEKLTLPSKHVFDPKIIKQRYNKLIEEEKRQSQKISDEIVEDTEILPPVQPDRSLGDKDVQRDLKKSSERIREILSKRKKK